MAVRVRDYGVADIALQLFAYFVAAVLVARCTPHPHPSAISSWALAVLFSLTYNFFSQACTILFFCVVLFRCIGSPDFRLPF